MISFICLKFASCFLLYLELILHSCPWDCLLYLPILFLSHCILISTSAVLLFLQHATFILMVGLSSVPWTFFPRITVWLFLPLIKIPSEMSPPSKRASLTSQINRHPTTFAHYFILIILLAPITIVYHYDFIFCLYLFICCLVFDSSQFHLLLEYNLKERRTLSVLKES